MSPLDNIRVVLVQPASPGNVGAVARVLKNTGLSRLDLVAPAPRDAPEARRRAHGSGEILDHSRVHESLAHATGDAHLVVGTTHRAGRYRVVEEDYAAVLAEAVELARSHQVALVFGREKDGLWHDELERCHRLIRLPSAVPYPSFNLSHAVLLVAHELFRLAGAPGAAAWEAKAAAGGRLDPITADELNSLCEHVLTAMATIGFRPFNDDPTNFRRVLWRVLSRTPLERRDGNVLHRICVQIEKFAQRHAGSAGAECEGP